MKKESVYFPHFCHARHDRKIKRVVKELGVEGYGIYFMLLEVLREQSDYKYPISDVDLLADEFNTSESKVKVVVLNYNLFEIDENNMFFSLNLIEFIQPYLKIKEQRTNAVNARWARVKALPEHTEVIRPYNDRTATVIQRKGKEIKGNEIKKKEKEKDFTPPTLEEVVNYFELNGYTKQSADRAFNYYSTADWVDSKGNKVRNWKQKMISVWFKEENKEVAHSVKFTM